MRPTWRRNPLTGLSGLQPQLFHEAHRLADIVRRNPLTGLSGLQLKWEEELGIPTGADWSQSPYGAKWLATLPP